MTNGAPATIWELNCPPCEDHLRHDTHNWSPTLEGIPETFDEKNARESFEKRGAKDKDAILTLALARLAGIDSSELPESLTRMITGLPAHIPGQLVCPSGHSQPPGVKFCGECGSPMHGRPAQAALPASQAARVPTTQGARLPKQRPASKGTAPKQAAATGGRRRLRDARLDELVKLAQTRNVDTTGNRAELIARLSAAGVTSNDLAALAAA